MQVTATAARVIRGFSYTINTQARAFGRQVEQIQGKRHSGALQPVLGTAKKLTNWIIRHTHNINPALGTSKLTHPVDAVLSKNPVHFPRSIKKQWTHDLCHPARGQSFDDDHIARTFRKDVFRQNVRLYESLPGKAPQKLFDSRAFHEQYHADYDSDQLLDQAGYSLVCLCRTPPGAGENAFSHCQSMHTCRYVEGIDGSD